MPSGRTHDRITLWTLPIVAGSTLAITRHSALTLAVCMGYLFGGLMLGPDLDTHSIHYKRWGWFRWIWIPYRGSLRHRSMWSHAPITGTTVRVLYLLLWLGLVSSAGIAIANEIGHLGWSWDEIGEFLRRSLQQYGKEAIGLCVGLELGAFSHYIADWSVSTHKRRKSRRRR
ncbi:MAG: metal-binding protein [Cyanobacteria bacterium CRU_2_1]|nr:metal-binding protein [Cyanobacteria bacterium RU_5_0]NJR58288.1 metal-binding protein [Cyanobacteria bacterium CRU_2_1]